MRVDERKRSSVKCDTERPGNSEQVNVVGFASLTMDVWAVEQKAKADAERKGQVQWFKKRRAS